MLDRCKHDSFLPSICELKLTQKDSRGKKTVKPCVTRVTSLFEKRFLQPSLSRKHNFFVKDQDTVMPMEDHNKTRK